MRPPNDPTNPLRQLRVALGSAENPCRASTIAKRLGTSRDTILSIECGRRNKGLLTHELKTSITVHLGARWDEVDKTWKSLLTGEPFSKDDYDIWTKIACDREAETEALCKGLARFLHKLTDAKFKLVADEVYEVIYELVRKHTKGNDWYRVLAELGPDFWEMDLWIGNTPNGPRRARGPKPEEKSSKRPMRQPL